MSLPSWHPRLPSMIRGAYSVRRPGYGANHTVHKRGHSPILNSESKHHDIQTSIANPKFSPLTSQQKIYTLASSDASQPHPFPDSPAYTEEVKLSPPPSTPAQRLTLVIPTMSTNNPGSSTNQPNASKHLPTMDDSATDLPRPRPMTHAENSRPSWRSC